MSNKQFISNLSATYADVRKLDVKKINLKGKNILEYIKASAPLDYRGTKANSDRDIVNSNVITDESGNIIIEKYIKKGPRHFFISNYDGDILHSEGCAKDTTYYLRNAATIKDGEVFDSDGNHTMFWDSSGFNEGEYELTGLPTRGAFYNDKNLKYLTQI